ncbi:ABC transporter substrate-binding protein [Pseudonocardia xishanensis]|uniref:Leucine-binding protein domain-containing protein n=1 Tax=Pseudonocardia xishanensis TaxID=630995 RepID=A0ABP8RZ06_9PSEU
MAQSRARLLLVALAGALALVGCGSGGQAASNDEFEVLYLGGLSGPLAPVTAQSVAGLKAAADMLNERGGVNGRRVVVRTEDTQEDAARATALAQRELMGSDKPDVVWAGATSTNAVAMAPVTTRAGVLSINQAQTPDLYAPSTYPLTFGFLPSADELTRLTLTHFADAGVTRIGVLASNDVFGQSFRTAFERRAAALGIEVVAEDFSTTDLDLTGSYQRIVAQEPQQIFINTLGPAAGRIMDARLKIGATDIPTVLGTGLMATGDGPLSYTSPQALENALMSIYTTQRYVAGDPDAPEPLRQFYTHYAQYAPKVGPNSTAQIAWNALVTVGAAAEQAKSADGPAIAAALEDLTPPDQPLWTPMGDFTSLTKDVHIVAANDDLLSFVVPVALTEGGFPDRG